MSTLVKRDCFAREELHCEKVYVLCGTTSSHDCAWCGNVRSDPKSGKPYLYRYTVETDGGRKHHDRKMFCSIGCRNAYHS